MTETPAPYAGQPARTADEARARLLELADAVGIDLIVRIAEAICRARQKHPTFAENFEQARRVVESEFAEWRSQALLVQPPTGALNMTRLHRAEAEATDLIATLSRFLCIEWRIS